MWKILVTALSIDLLLIIPLTLSYSLISNYIPRSRLPPNTLKNGLLIVAWSMGLRLAGPGIPVLAWLYVFYSLGVVLPPARQDGAFSHVVPRSLTEECVLRIGAMGVTLMAILSGFGSICAGWETYLSPHQYGLPLFV